MAHCTKSNNCRILADGLLFPNGLTRGLDGLFYVPSSTSGRISVYSLSSAGLTKVDEIELGMPIDNLSVDVNGDIFAACFPDSLKLLKAAKSGIGMPVPSTVWRIRKVSTSNDGKESKDRDTASYRVWKILEDRESKLLPIATTTAVHDAKSGRIFLGGVMADHLTVCEPSK